MPVKNKKITTVIFNEKEIKDIDKACSFGEIPRSNLIKIIMYGAIIEIEKNLEVDEKMFFQYEITPVKKGKNIPIPIKFLPEQQEKMDRLSELTNIPKSHIIKNYTNAKVKEIIKSGKII